MLRLKTIFIFIIIGFLFVGCSEKVKMTYTKEELDTIEFMLEKHEELISTNKGYWKYAYKVEQKRGSTNNIYLVYIMKDQFWNLPFETRSKAHDVFQGIQRMFEDRYKLNMKISVSMNTIN